MSTQAAAAEALALIRDSAPYRNAGGHLADAWARWEAANPNEHALLDAYVAGTTAAPQLSTKFGKGWVSLIVNGATQPTPEAARKLTLGALIVNAGNMNVDLLRLAGITHAAVDLNATNGVDFAAARWQGFVKGWFMVSRGNDGDTIASRLASVRADFPDVTFAVVDTESHKTDIGGSLAWTDTLYAALRSKLGRDFPLYNITFGVNSSPAVVNHIAFQRHNVTPIWEAYDGNGATLGVDRTAEKAELEGWSRPHVALGDKSVALDAAELKRGAVIGLGGVWLWAPEQAGDSLLALRGLA